MVIQLKQAYEMHGYAIAPQFLSPDEVAALTAIVDPIYYQWLSENQQAVFNEGLINMHSLTHPRYFKSSCDRIEFFEHLASAKLTDFLASLFDQDLYFHNTQLFFNPRCPDKQPYWHRDLQYSPIADEVLAAEQSKMLALHVRIPLEPETGIELIPGTHARWDTELERNVRLEYRGHRQHEDLPGAHLLSLQPGDILIFSANMLHRGNYLLNPSRKALDLCLGKSHPLTDPYLTAEVLPTQLELAQLSRPAWYSAAQSILAAQSDTALVQQ